MAEHNLTGQRGEQMAAAYLEKKGFIILETNWRFKNLEADIIARKDQTLILAEVKTRKSAFFGEPETFVTRQKQKNLIKTAHEYIERNNLDLEVRFDIVSIVLSDSAAIRHIEDAFYAVL